MDRSLDTISYMQRRTSLSTETFLIPISLRESEVVHSITSLANQLLSAYSDRCPSFQKRNYRFLIQKIEVVVQLLGSITEPGRHKSSILTCLTEFYIILDRARDLLIYCLESSRLRLLISNSMISSYFHNLDREILCILDVINWEDMTLNDDVADLLELMRKQLGQGKIFVDPFEESLKSMIFSFYEALEAGEVPDYTDVYKYFVKDLGIRDTKTWREESKSLKDMILGDERGIYIPSPVLRGFAALMQYSKLLIFGVQEDSHGVERTNSISGNMDIQVDAQTSITIPEDFLCPITHDLMIDPVILTTGQTFDRTSILDWFRRGNLRCPVTRTALSGMISMPNKAVQSLISKWCTAQGIPYNPPALPETPEEYRRNIQENSHNRAVSEAKKATAKLILDLLSQGLGSDQNLALAELRLLTQSDKQLCIEIVNAGSVSLLIDLLKSENHGTQESSAVTIMHLSLYTENKISIIQTQGSLTTILKVVQSAHTVTTREHATATLRNLSMVPEYKKKIAKEKGLLKTLSGVLNSDSFHDKINAMQTLKNLTTLENRIHLIKAGVVKVMAEAMEVRGFKWPAADVLAVLVTTRKGAKKIRKEKLVVIILTRMLQWGTPTEKDSAARTLLAFFRHGGSKAMRKSFQKPHLRDLVTYLLQSHLSEERSKAARLLRLHEKFEEWL